MRTTCACCACRSTCHTAPGFLVPGDLQQIVDRFVDWKSVPTAGVGLWTADHFRAHADGYIVPAMKDGRCVFLTHDGDCSIHDVSPYGCQMLDACMPPDEHKLRREAGMDQVVDPDDLYIEQWEFLAGLNLTSEE